jgi:hypothetical protein
MVLLFPAKDGRQVILVVEVKSSYNSFTGSAKRDGARRYETDYVKDYRKKYPLAEVRSVLVEMSGKDKFIDRQPREAPGPCKDSGGYKFSMVLGPRQAFYLATGDDEAYFRVVRQLQEQSVAGQASIASVMTRRVKTLVAEMDRLGLVDDERRVDFEKLARMQSASGSREVGFPHMGLVHRDTRVSTGPIYSESSTLGWLQQRGYCD